MAKVSEKTASQVEKVEAFEAHMEDLGGYVASFETYTDDMDPAPLFAGLPDDHCQCPHWGYVLEGRLIYRYDDGTEDVIGPGEAYYIRPGHLPLLTAGTRVVEFSPSEDLAATFEVVAKNAAAAG